MITHKQIQQIEKLYKEGKRVFEIAKILSISQGVVSYNLFPEVRKKRIRKAVEYFRNKSQKEKSAIYQTRKEYIRDYTRKRYQTDEKFRERKKELSHKYYRRKNG